MCRSRFPSSAAVVPTAPGDVTDKDREHAPGTFCAQPLDQNQLPITKIASYSGFKSIRQFNHAVRAPLTFHLQNSGSCGPA
jgi:hypothetical protein